jgi:uncharacterized membrane protein
MLKIKNKYPHTLWVTIMWYAPNCSDGGNWEKAGWWQLSPGQTKTVFGGNLHEVNRYYCYYAQASDGATWSGPYERSVPPTAFDWCEWTANTQSFDVGYRLLDIGNNDNFTLSLTP